MTHRVIDVLVTDPLRALPYRPRRHIRVASARSSEVEVVALLMRANMKFYSFGLVLILTALTPAYPAGPTPATLQAAHPAAWIAHDVIVDLYNLPRRYSCDDLREKFHDVLLALGVRADVTVLASRCELGSRSPSVRLHFSTPERVQRASTLGAVVIDVAAPIIHLEPGYPASLTDADCELMRQMKDRLIVPISRGVLSFNLACSAPPSRGKSFSLSVQAFESLDNGARVATLEIGPRAYGIRAPGF
jgi:hypothetical protein